MLDDLLGRTELKERIETLEEEIHGLERQRDAESERRREAVAARQEAEERVNRLEDRIADLEGKVANASDGQSSDAPAVGYRRREVLWGERLNEVLDRLTGMETGPEGALSAYIPDDRQVPGVVDDAFGDRATLVARATPCLAFTDDAGLVSVALEPPVEPDPFAAWDDEFRIEPTWFQPSGHFSFALVRSDTFALGVYEGTERVSVRGFTTDVKSKHSKGGFSQGRFERIREGQIRDHLEKCHEAIDEVGTDHLFVAGEGTLLDEFDATATASVDATGDPEAALDDAFRDFWTTRLYGI